MFILQFIGDCGMGRTPSQLLIGDAKQWFLTRETDTLVLTVTTLMKSKYWFTPELTIRGRISGDTFRRRRTAGNSGIGSHLPTLEAIGGPRLQPQEKQCG